MGGVTSVATNPDGAEVSYRWQGCKFVSQLRVIFSYIVTLLWWICTFNSFGPFSAPLAVYLFVFAIPLTALEFSTLFMACCTFCRDDGKFCKLWHFIMRLDGWQRGAFYIVIAFPTFIPGFTSVFAAVVGFLLILLGLMYVAKKFAIITIQVPPPTSFAQAGTPSAYSGSLPPSGGGPRDPNQFSTIP